MMVLILTLQQTAPAPVTPLIYPPNLPIIFKLECCTVPLSDDILLRKCLMGDGLGVSIQNSRDTDRKGKESIVIFPWKVKCALLNSFTFGKY